MDWPQAFAIVGVAWAFAAMIYFISKTEVNHDKASYDYLKSLREPMWNTFTKRTVTKEEAEALEEMYKKEFSSDDKR